ncbi:MULTISPECIES: 3'-5' exonuclease [unclassified Streptomyces]|uniref:3'-5' exonuclease n=1 Tax=unclassified Streptomyces TaxID=2593676 RepID=UPI0019046708|nr:3'-5' exonuclease [Streptomyces sp. HSG2]
MGRHRESLIGFDLETTGTDPLRARIVTGAVIELAGDEPTGRRTWLADPGVPIPEDAAAVHGVTTERATTEGRPAHEVVDAIAEVLVAYWQAGVPVVAYNAAFDLTLLSAELSRHGLDSLRDRLGGGPPAPVVDPYVIDRFVDPYRRGKRNLEAVCAEYGVPLETAHEASADALAAARLARAIAERHPKVAALGPAELHDRQVRWSADQAADLQAFLRRKGREGAVVDGSWPLRGGVPGAPADPPASRPTGGTTPVAPVTP